MGLLDRFKRRRRTLSANFSSYRNPRLSTRKPFQPKGEPRPRRTGFWPRTLRILKILAALVAVLGLFYVLLFTNLFQIQKINVEGGSDTLDEQSALNTSLQSYLGKNLLTLNTSGIEATLLEEYPYLKTLAVRRDLFHTLTVILESYANAANVRVDYDDGSQQFFVVNEDGYIASSGVSDESLPTVVMDVTATDAALPPTGTDTTDSTDATPQKPTYTLNQELIPKDTLDKLLQTAKDFTGKFNMQILEIHYLKQARELHLLTERHFSVWLDLTQDIDLQLTKLKKSLTSLNIYQADLDYIDLRISGQNGEKVIYRLNN